MPNTLTWQRVNVKKIASSLAGFFADQRGGIAVMMGLLFPVVLGALGIGFEISNWYMKKRAMQNAADAAAIAAASNAEENYNIEATAVAAHYGFVDGTDNVTVTASNDATCPVGTDPSLLQRNNFKCGTALFISICGLHGRHYSQWCAGETAHQRVSRCSNNEAAASLSVDA